MFSSPKSLQDSIYYYSALLFAFTLSLSHAAVSFFALWFIFLFIVKADYKKSWKLIKTIRALQIMGAFIAFIFLSLLWSTDTHEALHQIRLYSYWIIIPILVIMLKKEWLQSIITAFLGGMLVSEILSYGIYFGLWSINNATPEYPIPFMFHIHYSIFLATTSSLLLSRILSNRYTWQIKLPIIMFFLTSTTNLIISTGRTGQLAFLIATAIAVIIHYRLTIKSFLIFITLSSILFIGAYTTLPIFQKRFDQAVMDVQKLQEGDFDTSWGLRAAFWIVAYDIVREHPLVGVGIGDYKLGATEALTKNNHGFSTETIRWCETYDFHNQYLMILVQGGLIGFSLMIWIFIELFKLTIKYNELKEFSILGLTVFVISSISESLWTLQFPIILYIFIVAISITASINKESIHANTQ